MTGTEREYAAALFSLAVEENSVKEFRASLEAVKELLSENGDYVEFLACPTVELSERINCIEEAFGAFPEYIVSFLKVLCENGRAKTVIPCIDAFTELAMEYMNVTRAVISSVTDLSDAQKTAVIDKLKKLTGKNIEPVYITDISLIGGMKIEVDGKCYDGSIRHRLSEIKDVMNS
jgi:F-type H+-transporting ATPase subunit delta